MNNPSEVSVPKLRSILNGHFDISELKTLCLDLGVDYENLEGPKKEDITRDLVIQMKNNDRIPDLVNAVMARRLNIPEDEFLLKTDSRKQSPQSQSSQQKSLQYDVVDGERYILTFHPGSQRLLADPSGNPLLEIRFRDNPKPIVTPRLISVELKVKNNGPDIEFEDFENEPLVLNYDKKRIVGIVPWSGIPDFVNIDFSESEIRIAPKPNKCWKEGDSIQFQVYATGNGKAVPDIQKERIGDVIVSKKRISSSLILYTRNLTLALFILFGVIYLLGLMIEKWGYLFSTQLPSWTIIIPLVLLLIDIRWRLIGKHIRQ